MKRNTITLGALALAILASLSACGPEETPPGDGPNIDLTHIAYAPTPYDLPQPEGFPVMDIPADNPLTNEGVYLGRMLFYDPILSDDSTQSCSSCHFQSKAFTDPSQFSVGIDGIAGTRNSMPLFNVGYNANGFFWDGRAPTLEIQALEPIENPIEMHSTWEKAETKLRRHPMYQEHFRKAFGVENAREISRDHTVKALSQFMRTMISYRSKYDKALGFAPVQGIRPVLTEQEERGRAMFTKEFGSGAPVSQGGDPECIHCHQSRLFTNNTFRNNGLDAATSFNDFVDRGFGEVTGIPADNGRFRTPSLRNIELTGPYMHDGRFQTLEEVLEFYSEHLKSAPNIDSNLGSRIPGVQFSQSQIADMVAFLKTLTDHDFINDPQFSDPFQ